MLKRKQDKNMERVCLAWHILCRNQAGGAKLHKLQVHGQRWTVGPWTSHTASVCLHILICEMGALMLSSYGTVCCKETAPI